MRPALFALTLLAAPATAQVPAVVADIPPVQSLAAAVMEGLGEPALLLPPGASPHDLSLRPSEARVLARADVAFTIGEALSPAIEAALAAAPEGASVVSLLEVPGTRVLEGGGQPHDHGDDPHDHGGTDPHAWLDPANARLWLAAMAETLARRDPGNASTYAANAARAAEAITAAEAEARALLAPVSDRAVVVMHDALGYWQRAFDLPPTLPIADSDAARPGPARLSALRERMRAEGITCIMAEPQFDPKLAALVAEGSGARIGQWDPLGADLRPGPDLYPALLTGMAHAYADCAGGG